MAERDGARALIERVIDPGSFESWDEPIVLDEVSPEYRAVLEKARRKAGHDESIITGRAWVDGHEVALIVSEFQFLGGTLGQQAANRVVAAVRRATAEGIPLLAAPSSGGTRVQEGTRAFVMMVEIGRALAAHKAAGLPYFVYLRHPTTGGVLASWASLGHLTIAEPGALVGFLGPVVYKALYGEEFPAGVQLSDNLVRCGLVDAVVPVEGLAVMVKRALRLVQRDLRPVFTSEIVSQRVPRHPADPESRARAAWWSIEQTRRDDRPGVRELMRFACDDRLILAGAGLPDRRDALLLALASFSGMHCMLIAQDRAAESREVPLGPLALRRARRGMRLAQSLGLPLVTVIDTAGAELSVQAEEGGLATEIAYCLADLVSLTIPSVSVLLGQGTGGGALALLPSKRVIAAENGWLTPLPPEGASAIVYRNTEHAAEMAERQRIRSWDLYQDGIVHAVVPEPVPAHEDPEGFCRAVATECVRQIHAQLR
jgi:acetyl-CoA carboxylase carboxyl transferase subunit beta